MVHTANQLSTPGPWSVRNKVIKLLKFALLGRDLVPLVRFREGPYYGGFP